MFSVNCRKDEMIVVADLEGVFDHESEAEIGKLNTCTLSSDGDCVIWNFQGVTELTSSGIAILLNACSELKKNGSKTKLVNLGPKVLDALQVHKVVRAFEICTDELAAAKQIRIDLEERGEAFTRLFERIDVRLKARFKTFQKGGRMPVNPGVHSADARTLSRCGIFLHTEDLYPVDAVLDVDLVLCDGEDGPASEEMLVNFVGKVVWTADEQTQSDIYPGMALSIVSMEEDTRKMLESYLASRGG
jgi:anti-anti-sigma factor